MVIRGILPVQSGGQGVGVELVTIAEAAINFGVSQETIRRWMIDLDREGSANGANAANERKASDSTAASNGEVNWWETLVATLQSQVAGQQEQLSAKDLQLETKDRQIRELHVLLQQAQAALPSLAFRSFAASIAILLTDLLTHC